MQYPESVLSVARAMAAKHGDDIPRAVTEAEKLIRKLPEFDSLVDQMIRNAVREMVYDARHISNVATKRQTGHYFQEQKVDTTKSKAVLQAYKSVYAYCVAGTQLGLLYGERLAEIAESEQSIANGHVFNAALCRKLSEIVPKGTQVKDAISEKKLRALFDRTKKECGGMAA